MPGNQIYGVTEAITQGGRTAVQTTEMIQAEMQRIRAATEATVATMRGNTCHALRAAGERYQADMRNVCGGVTHHGMGLNAVGVDYEQVDAESAGVFQQASGVVDGLRA